MRFAWFITRKIAFSGQKSFSGFILKIAILAVMLSLSVMIVATSMIRGFQNEISDKVFNYWGHIHVSALGFSTSYQENPVSKEQQFYPLPEELKGDIKHIQVYANKAGLLKTDEDIEGLVLKGVSGDYKKENILHGIVEGQFPDFTDTVTSNGILLSEHTANRLQLSVGDDAIVYFIETPMRVRRFQVEGIYKSGIREFDQFYAFVDLRHIQRLNNWSSDQIGGFEIFIHDIHQLEVIEEMLYFNWLPTDLSSFTIKQLYPSIFDWLSLQNKNEVVIITLMILVAIINMSTALMILILERTNMVGLLKALGAADFGIQKIFMTYASLITGLGLLFGNILGLGIAFIQDKWKIIRLPEESYYLAYAPIEMHLPTILLLNLGTLVLCVALLLIPSFLVRKITPVKAIRWK